MTRLQFATQLLGQLRKEKYPCLTRYAILLAAASAGENGATVRNIAEIIDEEINAMGSRFQKLEELGLLRCIDRAERPARWTPTTNGLRIVSRLTAAKQPAID